MKQSVIAKLQKCLKTGKLMYYFCQCFFTKPALQSCVDILVEIITLAH